MAQARYTNLETAYLKAKAVAGVAWDEIGVYADAPAHGGGGARKVLVVAVQGSKNPVWVALKDNGDGTWQES